MARAKRICPRTNCPNTVNTRYCTKHEREYEAKRGTRQQRGYGKAHYQKRDAVAKQVEAGLTSCARCGQRIHPGTQWALDHDDADRTKYLGPSHKQCNDSAGGKAAHRTI